MDRQLGGCLSKGSRRFSELLTEVLDFCSGFRRGSARSDVRDLAETPFGGHIVCFTVVDECLTNQGTWYRVASCLESIQLYLARFPCSSQLIPAFQRR